MMIDYAHTHTTVKNNKWVLKKNQFQLNKATEVRTEISLKMIK